MIRVALQGLAARPLRTRLTALAIVLGVAMVSAAFTLTDTMRGAADSLSRAAYDGTDARRHAPAPPSTSAADDWTAQRPTVDAALLDARPRGPRRRRSPPATSPTRPRSSAATASPSATARTSASGSTRRRRAPTRSRRSSLQAGPLGDRAGRGRHRRRHGRRPAPRASAPPRASPPAAEPQRYRVVGIAKLRQRQVDRHGDVRRVRPARPRRRCSTGAAATTASSSRVATASRRRQRAPRRRAPPSAAGVQVQTAAAQDRFTLDGLKQFITIIKVALLVFGGVAILVGAFTIFNALSITVAQRTRELGLLRMVGAGRAPGARLRAARGAGARPARLAGRPRRRARDRQGPERVVRLARARRCPRRARCSRTRTIVVSLLVGTLVTLIAGLRAGVAGDPRRAGRGAARRRPGAAQLAPARPRGPRARRAARPPGAGGRRRPRACSRAATRCATPAARSAPPPR